MEEGTFIGWLKEEGQWVDSSQMLFVLEGDKAQQEVESFDAGHLRIAPDAPEPGDTVAVGQLIGYLVADGEPNPIASAAAQRPEPPSANAGATTSEAPARPKPPAAASGAAATTPRARRLAREVGVDCATVAGTGRGGRVREVDVHLAAAATRSKERCAGPAGDTQVPGQLIAISPRRRTIAQRMVAATGEAAPVSLARRADATRLVDLRHQLQSAAEPEAQDVPGYTDILIKLAAVAIQQHPMIQAQWQSDGLWLPSQINVGVAVDTEAGLVVPVIHNVPDMTLRQVATEVGRCVKQARSDRLQPDEMRGGTFTVTNLGPMGIDTFTPILNLPQSAILGVGRIGDEPTAHSPDRMTGRQTVALSLTFDHRVIDGAPAARFLQTLARAIEQPAARLVD